MDKGFWGAFFLSLVVLSGIMAATVTMVQPTMESSARHSSSDGYAYHPIGADALSLLVVARGEDKQAAACALLRFVPEKGQVPLTFLPAETLLSNDQGLEVTLEHLYEENGIAALRTRLEENLGIPIERYAVVDKDVFLSLCTKTGTVTTNLPEDIQYIKEDRVVDLASGIQKLDGQGIWEFAAAPYQLQDIPERSRLLGNLAAEFINQNLDAASEDRAQYLFTLTVNQIETDVTFTDFALRTQALHFVSKLEGVNVAGNIPVSGTAETAGFRLSEDYLSQLQNYF